MKRVIFCLLFDEGQFVLSRNFRRQKVGDINWVMNNYDLLNVSCGVDEISILDVGEKKDPDKFAECIRTISNSCFVPLSAGGGITDEATARRFINSGADKLVLNSAFYDNPTLPRKLADRYGSQCILASIDYRQIDGKYELYSANKQSVSGLTVTEHINNVLDNGAGELLLQSFDKDGTGMGLDLEFSNQFLTGIGVPCIALGGVGKAEHILQGLQHQNIDAVCTANLLNFIGDSLERSRIELQELGVSLPAFSSKELMQLKGYFAK